MRRWERWDIQELVPTNAATLVSTLNNMIRVPPRGQNYVLEIILGSCRTEKHIAKILGIEQEKMSSL